MSKNPEKVSASTKALLGAGGLMAATSMLIGAGVIEDIQAKSDEIASLQEEISQSSGDSLLFDAETAQNRIDYLNELKSIEAGLAVLFPVLGATTLAAAGMTYKFEKDDIASSNSKKPVYKTQQVTLQSKSKTHTTKRR